MENYEALIDYIFRNDNLDFYIDLEKQTVEVKDLAELNKELFFEVSELKKIIFTMFVNGQDISLKRIKTKLLESRKSFADFDSVLTFDIEEHNFKAEVQLEDIQKMIDIKNHYVEELVSLIDNFSFDTVHVPVPTVTFKTAYTVEELAYFFKLFIEQGIIVLDKNQKTKFFEFIAANFQSKDQTKISPDSIRNKSYDPSHGTIEKIREDLLQMLQITKFHRYSDKIEWKK